MIFTAVHVIVFHRKSCVVRPPPNRVLFVRKPNQYNAQCFDEGGTGNSH